jgi:hypothetical protein
VIQIQTIQTINENIILIKNNKKQFIDIYNTTKKLNKELIKIILVMLLI